MGSDRSDAWWLARSLVDKRGFDIVVRRHYDEIFVYFARAVGREEAADLTQQVFLVAFKRRRKFAGDDTARPWLFGIARNVLRRWYRTEGRRRRADGRLWGQAVIRPDFAEDADGRVSAEAVQNELRAALMALPRREREVFILYALGGLTYAEVADTADIPLGTVRSRIHRARLRLRPLLEPTAVEDLTEQGRTDG